MGTSPAITVRVRGATGALYAPNIGPAVYKEFKAARFAAERLSQRTMIGVAGKPDRTVSFVSAVVMHGPLLVAEYKFGREVKRGK